MPLLQENLPLPAPGTGAGESHWAGDGSPDGLEEGWMIQHPAKAVPSSQTNISLNIYRGC